jgi:hypothetical protein
MYINGCAEEFDRALHYAPVAQHDGPAQSTNTPVGERFNDNFRADAGGIAHGDGNPGSW